MAAINKKRQSGPKRRRYDQGAFAEGEKGRARRDKATRDNFSLSNVLKNTSS